MVNDGRMTNKGVVWLGVRSLSIMQCRDCVLNLDNWLCGLICISHQSVARDTLIPIHSTEPNQFDWALKDIHDKFLGKQLQLLIIILPDVTRSYGEQFYRFSNFMIRVGFFLFKRIFAAFKED